MMNIKRTTGIIIQARMGSSRLPGKMAREFYNGKSLLEIVLDRLIPVSESVPVVVATTVKSADDFIEQISKKIGVSIFRGSEEDVMSRFIGAAEENSLETIIRICADNPFIQPGYVRQLINYNEDLLFDYVGFRLNKNQPAIKTHLGFFPERVELKALKSLHGSGVSFHYREHVTNYFYSNLNKNFQAGWIDLMFPEEVIANIRLTIDVEKDFEIADQIYCHFQKNGIEGSSTEIINYVTGKPLLMSKMKENIRKNEK
jgi:spore coat polysaccharide biosynthesis protein SpsF (cytidylyltransferase family)